VRRLCGERFFCLFALSLARCSRNVCSREPRFNSWNVLSRLGELRSRDADRRKTRTNLPIPRLARRHRSCSPVGQLMPCTRALSEPTPPPSTCTAGRPLAPAIKEERGFGRLFGTRHAYWTPSQEAYRFPTGGRFLWKLGAFWRPFSFRARHDRGATQSCLEQIMSKGTVKWFNPTKGLWVHSTAGWRRQRCVCPHLCGRESRPQQSH
jgi:hypothetical protein